MKATFADDVYHVGLFVFSAVQAFVTWKVEGWSAHTSCWMRAFRGEYINHCGLLVYTAVSAYSTGEVESDVTRFAARRMCALTVVDLNHCRLLVRLAVGRLFVDCTIVGPLTALLTCGHFVAWIRWRSFKRPYLPPRTHFVPAVSPWSLGRLW